MIKLLRSLFITVLLTLLLFTTKSAVATSTLEGPVRPLLPSAAEINSGTLINAGMDDLAFYWRPTNHFVAGMWFEWWGNNYTIPEFIDGGHPHHNACYPPPPPGELCHNDSTGIYNSSQGYIRWGASYVAGIYQPVYGVTPCTLYEFKIYNRNDDWNYHPKVGIDPTGWQITRLGNSLPYNCPPDGLSRCPDPYIGDDHGFPSTLQWSAEFDHAPYTWAPGSITTEAISTTISVWTSAAPEATGSLSTYWDAGSLTQVAFPNGKLPAPSTWSPSGFIYDVQTTKGDDSLTINWKTQSTASTQVRYEILPYQAPISSTILISLTNKVYMPFIAKDPNPNNFTRYTTLDTTPITNHQAVITGILPGDTVLLVPLSRRPKSVGCTTETYTPLVIKFNMP